MILNKKYLTAVIIMFSLISYAVSEKENALKYYKNKDVFIREKKSEVYLIDFSGEEHIADNDLQYIIHFPNLRIIHLSSTNITSNGLKYLSDMKKLEALNLRKTGIDDSGMQYLKRLESLRELDLVETKVTDEGIQELAGLKNLDMLKLRGTKVTQKGIAKLQKKLSDCYITLETDEEIQ